MGPLKQSFKRFYLQGRFQKMGYSFLLIFQAASQTAVSHLLVFNLSRRVRKGCLLSGLLFVLGIELFNLVIQTKRIKVGIKGIKVGDEEIKKKKPYMQTTLLFFSEI